MLNLAGTVNEPIIPIDPIRRPYFSPSIMGLMPAANVEMKNAIITAMTVIAKNPNHTIGFSLATFSVNFSYNFLNITIFHKMEIKV